MNLNQQFDEHVKEQFGSYAPDVHPRIWENIIAEKERRKPVGFWVSIFNNRNKLLLAGLLIAVSTAGIWFYTNERPGLNDRNPEKVIAENTSTQNVDQNGAVKNEMPGNTTVSTAPQQDNIPAAGQDNSTITAKDPSTRSGLTSSTAGSAKFDINSPALEAGEVQDKERDNKTTASKKYAGLGKLLTVNTESPDLAVDDLAGQGSLLGRLTFEADQAASKRKKGQQFLSFRAISFLPDCPSVEKNAAGNKRYFEIYGGPDYAFRSMSDTGNSVYLQKRKESEKFRSAFSAGIRYTKVFNNSMSVRAGVNYSQINEKFTFTQGNLVQVTYIIDANGDTTGTYLTTGTRYKTTINKYRSIDIPVMIGYEVGNGKLHANINAGAVVNVYSWQKGEVLDRSLSPVNITTGKGSSPYQFKTNAGVGFIGAVSVYYKLNDRLHVMAEPYFRYNFTPITKEGTTLKQKYHTAGLRLGIRLDLK